MTRTGTGTSSSSSQHTSQQQQNQQSQSSESSSATQRLEKLSLHVMRGEAPVFFPDAVPLAPEDALFGMMREYRLDTSPDKVDLGIGAYRDNNAKPWVLPVVKKVCLLLSCSHRCSHCSHFCSAIIPIYLLSADNTVSPLTLNAGRRNPSQHSRPQPRISSHRWSCGLYLCSSAFDLGREQPCDQGQSRMSAQFLFSSRGAIKFSLFPPACLHPPHIQFTRWRELRH